MTTWYNLAPQPNWQEWTAVSISANPSEFLFSADSLTDIITVSAGSNYFTGKAVMVSSVGGALPSPLNASSVYYIIYLSPTSYALADTYQNALDAIDIDLTSNGTGTLTIISTGVTYLQPNSNGYMHTYSSLNHDQNKDTFTDWTGATQNTNPIIFNSKGQATIYWEVNSADATDNYYIEIYTANGVLMYSRDNFNAPPGLESTSPTDTVTPINMLLNNQFDFWGMYDYGIDSISDVVANMSKIAADPEFAYYWYFVKSNNNATDYLTRKLFAAGQTEVPNTPVYYLNASCTDAGIGGETFKYFYQSIRNVQNLGGLSITLSFWAKAATNGTTMSSRVDQYFGATGSATVETEGDDFVLTTTWAQYTSTIAVPSLSGKNVQAASTFRLVFDLPVNSTFSIDVSNTQLTIGETAQGYRQLSSDERFSLLAAPLQELTGAIKPQAFGTLENGWIPLANGTIGNAVSGATILANTYTSSLFRALWTNYNDVMCPVYDSAGVKVDRGVDANTDFDADRRIMMFFNSGRVISNSGSPTIEFTYTAQIDTVNTITIDGDALFANKTLRTGTAVTLYTTGVIPTGLALATTYYIIVTSASTGVYQLALSFADALAGTPIVITDAGTGIQRIVANSANDQFNTMVSGQGVGESAHYQLQSELAAHHHQFTAYDSTGVPLANGFSGSAAATSGTAKQSTTTGTNAAMNVTQPTLSLPHVIKL